MKYESLNEKPISHCAFAGRMLVHSAIAAVILVGMVVLSTLLLYSVETDTSAASLARAFHQSALYLGGFGVPEDPKVSVWGRLVHGALALFAGVVFATVAGVMLAPIFHRVLHWLHWNKARDPNDDTNCLLTRDSDRASRRRGDNR